MPSLSTLKKYLVQGVLSYLSTIAKYALIVVNNKKWSYRNVHKQDVRNNIMMVTVTDIKLYRFQNSSASPDAVTKVYLAMNSHSKIYKHVNKVMTPVIFFL